MKRNYHRVGPASVIQEVVFKANPCRVAVMFTSSDQPGDVEVYPYTDSGIVVETFRPNIYFPIIYFNTALHGDLPTMEWRAGNAFNTWVEGWEWVVPFEYLAKSLDDFRTDYGRALSRG
jgi:hypothetical protein